MASTLSQNSYPTVYNNPMCRADVNDTTSKHPIMDAVDRGSRVIGHCLLVGILVPAYAVPVTVITAIIVPVAVPFAVRSLIKYGDLSAIPSCLDVTFMPLELYHAYRYIHGYSTPATKT